MQTQGNIRANFLRVVKMSEACGVDLSSALDKGQITASDYGDLVTACRGCTQAGHCDRLLAAAPVLLQAPDYCVNRDHFGQLRAVQAG